MFVKELSVINELLCSLSIVSEAGHRGWWMHGKQTLAPPAADSAKSPRWWDVNPLSEPASYPRVHRLGPTTHPPTSPCFNLGHQQSPQKKKKKRFHTWVPIPFANRVWIMQIIGVSIKHEPVALQRKLWCWNCTYSKHRYRQLMQFPSQLTCFSQQSGKSLQGLIECVMVLTKPIIDMENVTQWARLSS